MDEEQRVKNWRHNGYAMNPVTYVWEDVKLLSKVSLIELLVETKDGQRYQVPISDYKSKARQSIERRY